MGRDNLYMPGLKIFCSKLFEKTYFMTLETVHSKIILAELVL